MAHAGGYLTRREAVGALLAAAGMAALPMRGRAASAQAGAGVRFTVFAARPIADLAYVPRPGAAVAKLQFYPTARSPRYEYRGAMPLRIVEAATGTVVAEATLPADLREALLLFSLREGVGSATSPGAGKGAVLRYQVSVLDDSAARHPAGALSILNLSGWRLEGSAGKRALAVEAGLGPTLPLGGAETAIALSTTIKGRAYTAYRSTVKLRGRQRALLVLLPPFQAGGVEAQSRLLVDEPGR